MHQTRGISWSAGAVEFLTPWNSRNEAPRIITWQCLKKFIIRKRREFSSLMESPPSNALINTGSCLLVWIPMRSFVREPAPSKKGAIVARILPSFQKLKIWDIFVTHTREISAIGKMKLESKKKERIRRIRKEPPAHFGTLCPCIYQR